MVYCWSNTLYYASAITGKKTICEKLRPQSENGWNCCCVCVDKKRSDKVGLVNLIIFICFCGLPMRYQTIVRWAGIIFHYNNNPKKLQNIRSKGVFMIAHTIYSVVVFRYPKRLHLVKCTN